MRGHPRSFKTEKEFEVKSKFRIFISKRLVVEEFYKELP